MDAESGPTKGGGLKLGDKVPTEGSTPPPGRKPNRRPIVIVAAAVASAMLVAVGLVVIQDEGPETKTDVATASRSPAPTSKATTPTPPRTAQPSAAETLTPFFVSATTLDEQLHEAATAINGPGMLLRGTWTRSSSPPWEDTYEEVATDVKAADLAPVAQAIPAGLPSELLRSVILVYGDLSSRRHAMDDFSGSYPILEEGDQLRLDYDIVLDNLGQGSAAAARFDADLAAARSLAASSAPITTPPADSRQAAERALLVAYVEGVNTACGLRGGVLVTQLPSIEWTTSTFDGLPVDGAIAGKGFTAEPNPDGTWNITIMFC